MILTGGEKEEGVGATAQVTRVRMHRYACLDGLLFSSCDIIQIRSRC